MWGNVDYIPGILLDYLCVVGTPFKVYTYLRMIYTSEYGILKYIVHFAFTPMRCTKMTGN